MEEIQEKNLNGDAITKLDEIVETILGEIRPLLRCVTGLLGRFFIHTEGIV